MRSVTGIGVSPPSPAPLSRVSELLVLPLVSSSARPLGPVAFCDRAPATTTAAMLAHRSWGTVAPRVSPLDAAVAASHAATH